MLFTVIRGNLKPVLYSEKNYFKLLFMKKHFLIMGAMLISASASFAAGFQLNLQGLRQLAMGGSGTAVPWDASTIFYNPGGLTAIRNVQVYGSVLGVVPTTKYVATPTGTYSATTVAQTFTPFNVYVGAPIRDKSNLSIGLGVYTPFGTGTKWEDDWRGRYITQEAQLQSIFFQPTVAYRFNDVISIGAGFVYAVGGMELRRGIPLQDMSGTSGDAELTGDANGLGFNIGVHINATDKVQFGVSYRSQVNMKVRNGYARFHNIPSSLSSNFNNTSFTTNLKLPQVATVGVGIKVSKDVMIQADINYVGWASYDSLIIDYKNNTSALSDTRAPRRYKNTVAFRAGANYKVSDKVSLMIGGAWDPTPVRDGFVSPDLPDANRIVGTCGATLKVLKKFTVMGSVEYSSTVKREGSYNVEGFSGKYQSTAIIPGLAVSYDF